MASDREGWRSIWPRVRWLEHEAEQIVSASDPVRRSSDGAQLSG